MWKLIFRKTIMFLTGIVVTLLCVHLSTSSLTYNTPGVHSLATYVTTNSYLYPKHLGLNYRSLKPATSFSAIPSYKISSPYLSRVINLPPQISTQTYSSQPQLGAVESLSTDLQQNAKLIGQSVQSQAQDVVNELNTVTIPQLNFASNPNIRYEVANGFNSKNNEVLSGILKQVLRDAQNRAIELFNRHSVISDSTIVKGDNYSLPLNYEEKVEIPHFQVGSNSNSGQIKESGFSGGDQDLLGLVQKISSHGKVNIASSNDASEANVESGKEPEMQSRQDSSLEQPVPFFPQLTQPKRPLNNAQFVPPQQTPASQFPTQHTPISFPQNTPSNTPQQQQQHQQPFQQQQPQGRRPLGSNRLKLTPNPPPARPQQSPQFNPPPPLQFPRFPQNSLGGAAPPPGPEPENGYNPFHLHETYPEPPFESEFVNEPPLNDEISSESPGPNAYTERSPSVDFAQNTLRNVRTEELLEVTQRKPVPPDCAYNTISYGVNGEDCVQRKRRQS